MRFVRGLAALLALVGLLVGIPVALVVFGGNPLPADLSGQALIRAFLTPASDRVLLGIVAVVGWLAWAGFALSVAAEIVNAASGRRVQLRLPGLGVGQKVAATLIVLVVAMLATPHLTPASTAAPITSPTSSSSSAVTAPAVPGHQARPGPAGEARDVAHPAPTAGASTATTPGVTAPGGRAGAHPAGAEHRTPAAAGGAGERGPAAAPQGSKPAHITHEVKRGEFLWSLSERYLGDGSRWREIARANPGVDPDELRVGQHLRIPVPATAADHDGGRGQADALRGDTIKVERGDNLSEISEDLYGSERHWPELYQSNRDQIDDPDLIEPGQVLLLPGRDYADRPDHKVTHHSDADADAPRSDRHDERQAPDTSKAQPGSSKPTAPADSPDLHAGPVAPTAPARPASTAAQPPAAQPTVSQPASQPGEATPSAASSTSAGASPAGRGAGQGTGQGAGQAPEGAGERVTAAEVVAGSGASVGLLLAAGLLTRLGLRRRRQLQMRRPGRRITPAAAEAQTFEHAVRAQHEPLRVEQLDQVLRAIAAHSHHAGTDLPALSAVRVDDTRIDLLLQRPALQPPPGVEVTADGSVWTLHAGDIAAVLTVDGIDDMAPPYPALVTLGRDSATAHVLIDLEAAGALSIAADDPDTAAAMLSTIALELAVSPWAADVNLTLVGPLLPGLAETLDHPSLIHIDDAERALAGLEVRAAAQRQHLTGSTVGQKRADPQLADAWCPHVVLIAQELDDDAAARLARIVTDLPRVAVAAVTTADPAVTRWQYRIDDDGQIAHLEPHGWDLTPQLVSQADYDQILDLVASSGTEETEPAPWWDHEAESTEPDEARSATVTTLPVPHHSTSTKQDDLDEQDEDGGRDESAAVLRGPDTVDRSDPDPEQVAATTVRPAARAAARSAMTLHTLTSPTRTVDLGTLSGRDLSGGSHDDEPVEDDRHVGGSGSVFDLDALDLDTLSPDFTEPTLQILGPPVITAAAGQTGTRYQRRGLEVMLYLLEHPGTTSTTLMSRFCITRDYTKSVISALRKMLGRDPEGRLYLPELAGSGGGYRLDPIVTSDWSRVRRLIGRGVNTAADENLMHVLSMVRGAPLEGAEDWIGADVLRPDISSTISDAAHQLVDRALDRNDLGLARWAAARGLLAEPESETLLVDRLRTEAQAGNRNEVARLSGRIETSVRHLGGTMCEQTQEALRAVAVYR